MDSTIVIYWLRKEIATLKPIVANRVSEILRNSQTDQFNHVPGNQNSAELAPRECVSEQLKTTSLWWNGSEWLQLSSEQWPTFLETTLSQNEVNSDKAETKACYCSAH